MLFAKENMASILLTVTALVSEHVHHVPKGMGLPPLVPVN